MAVSPVGFTAIFSSVLQISAERLIDILVVTERLLEACVHVGNVIEAVGVTLKAFKGQRINHRRIVEVKQLHIAELVHALINEVDIGIFLAVLTHKFLHNYLGADGSLLLYGIG